MQSFTVQSFTMQSAAVQSATVQAPSTFYLYSLLPFFLFPRRRAVVYCMTRNRRTLLSQMPLLGAGPLDPVFLHSKRRTCWDWGGGGPLSLSPCTQFLAIAGIECANNK